MRSNHGCEDCGSGLLTNALEAANEGMAPNFILTLLAHVLRQRENKSRAVANVLERYLTDTLLLQYAFSSGAFVAPQIGVDKITRLIPVHDGHVDVEYDNLEVVYWMRLHNLKSLLPVLRRCHVKIRFKLILIRKERKAFVVDKEHPRPVGFKHSP
jgi:hypothetical protein